jgi:hypothetical protein
MATLLPWISSNLIQTLNIAGSRESSEPGIYDFTLGTLMKFVLLQPSNP